MKSLRCSGRRIEIWLLVTPPAVVVAGPVLRLGGSLTVHALQMESRWPHCALRYSHLLFGRYCKAVYLCGVRMT